MTARWQVSKRIDFCYGHRLIDYAGKCRHLHGHNGLVEVCMASSTLDGCGMVYDFTEIKRLLKGWIDAHLDHKMILCRRDPLVPVLREAGEPLYLLDDNPTAENIAREVFINARKMGLPTVAVRLWETPASLAVYGED